VAFRPTQVPEELGRRAYDFILRIPRRQSHLAMASLLSGLTAELQRLNVVCPISWCPTVALRGCSSAVVLGLSTTPVSLAKQRFLAACPPALGPHLLATTRLAMR